MDISVCMIVKDEEKFLDDCLNSVKDFASEIIIVDTGSTDSTKTIARMYTDRVFDFEWVDDFSAARNFSVSFASSDWVMIIDADERLASYDKSSIQELFAHPESLGYVELENNYGTDAAVRTSRDRLSRIFNKNYYEFSGTVHEQLVRKDNEPKAFMNVDLLLLHYGYGADVMEAKNKNIRNRALIESALAKDGDDPYLYFQLGKTYIASDRKDYKKANELFRRAVELEKRTEYEYFFDLIHTYGYSLVNAGEYSKALDIAKYKDRYINRADYAFLLAHVYMNNAMFDAAIDLFRRCLSMKEEKAEGVTSFLAHYNIGVIYECTGNIPLAAENYVACGNYPPARARLKEITH